MRGRIVALILGLALGIFSGFTVGAGLLIIYKTII